MITKSASITLALVLQNLLMWYTDYTQKHQCPYIYAWFYDQGHDADDDNATLNDRFWMLLQEFSLTVFDWDQTGDDVATLSGHDLEVHCAIQ